MSAARQCTILIDYESLLFDLSQTAPLDVEQLVVKIVKTAQQQYDLEVTSIYLLADWRRFAVGPKLKVSPYTCFNVLAANNVSFGQHVQALLAQSILNSPSQVYLFAGGGLSYGDAIQQVRNAGGEVILWTTSPPSIKDRTFATSYQPFIIPRTDLSPAAWPRAVMLHAIALLADEVRQASGQDLIGFWDLAARLGGLDTFGMYAQNWLNVAIREQVLILFRRTETLYIQINHEHAVIQNAFQIRGRILSTLNAILSTQWGEMGVSYSTLEQALRSFILLSNKMRMRHAWIEMLGEMGVLILQPYRGSSVDGVTVQLNLDHPMVAANEQHRSLNIIRLVLVLDQACARSDNGWITEGALLNHMTGLSSHLEARSALQMAKELAIVEEYRVGTGTSNDRPYLVYLRPNKLLDYVNEIMALRDDIIMLVSSLISDNDVYGLSQRLLLEKLEFYLTQEYAAFWLQTLLELRVLQPSMAMGKALSSAPIAMLRLNAANPAVYALLHDEVNYG